MDSQKSARLMSKDHLRGKEKESMFTRNACELMHSHVRV
jgi:hypothetical protein